MSLLPKIYQKSLKKCLSYLIHWPLIYWQNRKLNKVVVNLVSLLALGLTTAWGIGQWYIYSQRTIPLSYGVSFVPDYAQSLGLNPKQTLTALIKIGVRQFRLTSYWSDIQPLQGQYNFSQLDWEFAQANAVHAKIILTVGLRQPRWPECHAPNWINTTASMNHWEPQLLGFMTKVIDRYKNNSALEAWQLENEYFLKGFGDCQNYSRSRLITEYSLLKKLDPNHLIIVGRSNNALGFPVGKPTPNVFGISLYRRVWDEALTHRYLEYPFAPWFYAFMAGVQELYSHKNMIITEMQAEPWPPNSQSITQVSLQVQNQTLTARRLKDRFSFARATGIKDVIMWGAEYWYYRKEILHDPSVWNVAKQEFKANHYHDGQQLLTQSRH